MLYSLSQIITCMVLFVCPHNYESLLNTIRLVCITGVIQECNIYVDNPCLEKALVLQQMFLSHWLELCASSLSFSSLSWCLVAHLLQKKWTDWVLQWFWVESNLLHAAACTVGRSWDSKSCDLESRANTTVALLCRAFWRFLKAIISFYNIDTIQLWSRCHAYATAVFF